LHAVDNVLELKQILDCLNSSQQEKKGSNYNSSGGWCIVWLPYSITLNVSWKCVL